MIGVVSIISSNIESSSSSSSIIIGIVNIIIMDAVVNAVVSLLSSNILLCRVSGDMFDIVGIKIIKVNG